MEYLGLTRTRVDKILARNKSGKHFYDDAVAPRALNDTAMDKLITSIDEFKGTAANPLTMDKITGWVNKLAAETHVQRGHNGLKMIKHGTSFLDPRTIQATLDSIHNFKFEKGQTTTTPRKREGLAAAAKELKKIKRSNLRKPLQRPRNKKKTERPKLSRSRKTESQRHDRLSKTERHARKSRLKKATRTRNA
jgi:hypothetical protein